MEPASQLGVEGVVVWVVGIRLRNPVLCFAYALHVLGVGSGVRTKTALAVGPPIGRTMTELHFGGVPRRRFRCRRECYIPRGGVIRLSLKDVF